MACRIVNRLALDPETERADVLAGLLRERAEVSPKYFYDELGCALYGAICRLPEYYPPRLESALFEAHRGDIARALGTGRQFVDLGAGDCRKAMRWFRAVRPRRYLAVDIAEQEIHGGLTEMGRDFPGLERVGVVTDFSRRLDLAGILDGEPATFFYPGSSIGNFAPRDAVAFLRQVHGFCAERPGSGLLIGVDARKERDRLVAAYDDALGVTAAFNRNVLRHLNRRFGFDFPDGSFAHRALYDEDAGRIEMHLEAVGPRVVDLAGHERRFDAGERIHTENSYKYTATGFEALLAEAGFDAIRRWAGDGDGYFAFYAS